MNTPSLVLIGLEKLSTAFTTDEIETSTLAFSIHRVRAYSLSERPVESLRALARRDPQPRDRLRLEELQLDRRPPGTRRRRAPADLRRRVHGTPR